MTSAFRYAGIPSLLLFLFIAPAYADTSPFGAEMLNPTDELMSFNATLSADGNTVYFSRATKNWSAIHIYTSRYQEGRWSTPILLQLSNGNWRDTDPFLADNGQTLYFNSDRPLAGEEYKNFHYRLWMSHLTGSGWSEPELVSASVNEYAPLLYPSVTDSGELYFFTNRSNGSTLYRAKREADGSFNKPEPAQIPGAYMLMDPVVSRDGNSIYFAAAPSPERKHERYIWISRKSGSAWSKPERLSDDINLGNKQIATGLSPDNLVLFFASTWNADAEAPIKLRLFCASLSELNAGKASSLPSLQQCLNKP